MRSLIFSCLFAALPAGAFALDVNEWLALKDRYLNQPARADGDFAYLSEPIADEIITTEELFSALPPADQWDALAAALQESIAEDDASLEAMENQLMLAVLTYLTAEGDRDAATATALKQAKARWEKADFQLDEWHLEQITESLNEHIARAEGREISYGDPGEELKYFEQEIAEHEPVNREDIAALVGGEDKLKAVETYMTVLEKEQEKLYAEMRKKYATLGENATEEQQIAIYEEMSSKMEAIAKQNQEAAGMLEKLMDNPKGSVFLQQAYMQGGSPFGNRATIYVPDDLLAMAGKKRARELLQRAFLTPAMVQLPEAYQEESAELRRLGKEVALANIDKLQTPQWALVDSLDDVELVKQLNERFTAPTGEEQEYLKDAYWKAQSILAVSLFQEKQVGQATDILAQVDEDIYSDAFDVFEEKENNEAAYAMFQEIIRRNPKSPFWDYYARLARQAGREADLQAIIRVYGNTPGAPAEHLLDCYQALIVNRLNDNDTEGAIALYREALAMLQANAQQQVLKFEYDTGGYLGNQCVALGKMLDNADIVALGLEILEAANTINRNKVDEHSYGIDYEENELLGAYQDLEDYAALEALAQQEIKYVQQLAKDFQGEDYEKESVQRDAAESIARLMGYYFDALYGQQRYADIVNTLNTSTQLNANYLSEYLDRIYIDDLPAKFAYALHTQGQTAAAIELLEQRLLENDDNDQLYEVYIAIRGEDAIPFLDFLTTINRFEERPLIWKAQALLEANKINQAEEVILQAMTMDPSDGDQGKGDRMRVYAVLGAIREAQGNNKDAAFFDSVLHAIRISEDADDYYRAGLHQRAIDMYKEALTYFVDAYCIQSRLAVRLMDEGREEEAIEHYAKAYELMPDSFGRIESHCFGCEGAFRGEVAQGIAQTVFTNIIAQDPTNPQAYYLMAYLRMEQDRDAEAISYLQKAVELDPEYINAWNKLRYAASDSDVLSPEEKDNIQLKLLEIDPLERHSSIDFEEITDPKRFWPVLQEVAAINRSLAENKKIYPLPNSKREEDSHSWSRYDQRDSAGEMLLRIAYLEDMIRLLNEMASVREVMKN